MRLSDYDYELPDELIAQRPADRRDGSRMMVVHRATGDIQRRVFSDIGEYITPNYALVLNDTRVIPARLHGRKVATGGRVEILLLKPLGDGVWETLARPGRRLNPGANLTFGDGKLNAEVIGRTDGEFRLRFDNADGFDAALRAVGEIPLPPYINREADDADRDRYQCVYAARDGAVAAPTAGLHFTPELLERLQVAGVKTERVTLHVGLGTFQPLQPDDIENTRLHAERAAISPETVDRLRRHRAEGGLVCAVGTTSARTLETAALSGELRAFDGETELFIKPGFKFRAMDALLTNFHLPKSSLLMLVAAFAGYDLMRRAYEVAVRERYRFYSYGDAMLIL